MRFLFDHSFVVLQFVPCCKSLVSFRPTLKHSCSQIAPCCVLDFRVHPCLQIGQCIVCTIRSSFDLVCCVDRTVRVNGVLEYVDHARSFPWDSVMGTWLATFCGQPVTPNSIAVVSSRRRHVFTILALLIVTCRSCNVEQCWSQYVSRLSGDNVREGPNRAYCVTLREFTECIRAAARSCRGDLQYHTYSSMALSWNNNFNCSYVVLHASSAPPVTGTVQFSPSPNTGLRLPHPSKTRPQTSNQQCSYRGRHEHGHCGLFGGTHLRTFLHDEQTCKILGARSLVDNAFLAIQVTSEMVPGNSHVTAITKVTVIVKGGNTLCSSQKTYEAQVDNLPASFIDGTHFSGTERSVRVKEREPSSHVEIHVRHVSTTISIRQFGRYLTIAIRMPLDVTGQGVSSDDAPQLCLVGCPTNERIDRAGDASEWLSLKEMAVTKCRAHGLVDFFLESCVVDLMAINDASFILAAQRALHDLRALNPHLVTTLTNRTDVFVHSATATPESVPEAGSIGSNAEATGTSLLWLSLMVFVSKILCVT